jgi:hypothetical protein
MLRRFAQDDADLILHRAAVARRAQPQQLLQPVIELADSQAGHAPILADDCIAINAIIRPG